MSAAYWASASVYLSVAERLICRASAELSKSRPSPREPGAAEWYECNRLLRHLDELLAKVNVRVSIQERRDASAAERTPPGGTPRG